MSNREKTEGIVIRMADFSETSRVVEFFTRDFGKISVLAKGAKRLKSSFEAALDLLTRCQIVFLHKSTNSLDILTEAKLVSRFRPGARDVNGHYAGLYVAELLHLCSEPFDPHPLWYDSAVCTLDRLQQGDVAAAVLRFELLTLQELGLLPEFTHCRCGEPVAADRQQWSVWIQQGVLLCSKCRQPEWSSRPLTGAVLTILRELAETPCDAETAITISPSDYKIIRPLMTALISQTVEHRPKMLAYLKF